MLRNYLIVVFLFFFQCFSKPVVSTHLRSATPDSAIIIHLDPASINLELDNEKFTFLDYVEKRDDPFQYPPVQKKSQIVPLHFVAKIRPEDGGRFIKVYTDKDGDPLLDKHRRWLKRKPKSGELFCVLGDLNFKIMTGEFISQLGRRKLSVYDEMALRLWKFAEKNREKEGQNYTHPPLRVLARSSVPFDKIWHVMEAANRVGFYQIELATQEAKLPERISEDMRPTLPSPRFYSSDRGSTSVITSSKQAYELMKTKLRDINTGGIDDMLSGLLGGRASRGVLKPPSTWNLNCDEPCHRSYASILRTFRQHTPGLRYEYNKYMRRTEEFEGQMVLKIEIVSSGKVAKIWTQSGTINHFEFETEIMNKVRRWRFEPISDFGNDTFTIPFEFYIKDKAELSP